MLSTNHSLFPLNPSLFPTTRFRNQVHRFSSLSLGSVGKPNCYKVLCKNLDENNSEEGGSSFLEAEILEFMQNSKNPKAFPTREELVAAGRGDLVEAIVKKGGWLTLGWDLNDGGSQEIEDLNEGYQEIEDFEDVRSSEIDGNATWDSGDKSSQPDSSGEIEAGESGIEGILNRLEKERNSSFGLEFREKEDSMSSENHEDKDERDYIARKEAIDDLIGSSSRPSTFPTCNGRSDSQIKLDHHRSETGSDDSRSSLKPESWRTWIIQRTGFSNADFEDAEIAPRDVSGQQDILKIREFSDEPTNRETGLSLDRNKNHTDVKSRILHLESELSSVLHSLRSTTDQLSRQTDQKSSSDELSDLSDAWEFQENEIMNAQDRLRSIRAKLAVLQGKMTVAITDALKEVDEKQKKINNANKALQFLKSTSVVWPNTASEVFLVGSFDGWSTKIKFIVDGEWKTDPLRPLVDNNGHVNNLLIVHG
ncbi:hypothetical protein RIF29_15810 [Crotalaria pallida]|uniref:AMP-activated protein kinase glycogen-binding domain-containing protein n=1 Tax=Crotalaria pallida TaxID=3830 RepID=A0AAN9FMI6_CROPI